MKRSIERASSETRGKRARGSAKEATLEFLEKMRNEHGQAAGSGGRRQMAAQKNGTESRTETSEEEEEED